MARDGNGVLTPQEARKVYNRIGRMQDWQRFYEAAAVKDLIAHAELASADRIFEFGCGTGALARELFDRHLGPDTTYLGGGSGMVSRAVGRGWKWVWDRAPKVVGGCRPVSIVPILAPRWHIVHRAVVTAWGVPSEVVVATRLGKS